MQGDTHTYTHTKPLIHDNHFSGGSLESQIAIHYQKRWCFWDSCVWVFVCECLCAYSLYGCVDVYQAKLLPAVWFHSLALLDTFPSVPVLCPDQWKNFPLWHLSAVNILATEKHFSDTHWPEVTSYRSLWKTKNFSTGHEQVSPIHLFSGSHFHLQTL